jgi:hypothetical protein
MQKGPLIFFVYPDPEGHSCQPMMSENGVYRK